MKPLSRKIVSLNRNWRFVRMPDPRSESDDPVQRAASRKPRTDWQSQYNITFVQLGDGRYDLKPEQLEDLKNRELQIASGLSWEPATLPHAANIEKLGVSRPWQGICFYKRTINAPEDWKGKTVTLTLEGAMQVSSLWLNGTFVGGRRGGYLPVVIDLTRRLKPGANELLARLDNRDNPLVPPGKPTPDLDFLYWSGLYRDAYLTVTGRVHITDPILAGEKAGGGVYAFCPEIGARQAVVEVRTHVVNGSAANREAAVVQSLYRGNRLVAKAETPLSLEEGRASRTIQQLKVERPSLWSPDAPNLYKLVTRVKQGTRTLDEVVTRIGIRRFEFSRKKGFVINGRQLRLIGTNRHQEYPYIGNALSNNAGYRDMKKIKDAGFNGVRLAHYPMAPAVMDACDELGLLTIPCIAGWQFHNSDPRFTGQVIQDIRDLIRRDRNHPCAMAWETSLNETYPSADIVARWYSAAHEEFLAPDMAAVGDGAWVMYDYHRGYDSRVEYSGMANVFRLPRYVYRFFRAQYRPEPIVFVCSDWTPRRGRTKVVVFSNGDTVELILNGRTVGRQRPDNGPDTPYGDYGGGGNPWDGGNCRHLVHPPFTFFDVPYEPGVLKAVACRNGRKTAEHTVRTPEEPAALRLRIDESGRKLRADGADCVFVYADVVDKNGTVCTQFEGSVDLSVKGGVRVVGPTKAEVENGTASFLVQSTGKAGTASVSARASIPPQSATASLPLSLGRVTGA